MLGQALFHGGCVISISTLRHHLACLITVTLCTFNSLRSVELWQLYTQLPMLLKIQQSDPLHALSVQRRPPVSFKSVQLIFCKALQHLSAADSGRVIRLPQLNLVRT